MLDEIRIVIADDHPLFSGLLGVLSEHPNMRVVGQAADGATAWEMIRKELPTVAILDISMPKMDGIEVARAIQMANLEVEVVILTADDDQECLELARRVGAKGFLNKDSAMIDVTTCVKAVAAGRVFISIPTDTKHTPDPSSTAAREILGSLTPTELRILRMISEGKSRKISQLNWATTTGQWITTARGSRRS